jgi:Protein of unknown function (DUF3800)
MATLHIHLDESGNFAFSPKGTRFFIFTAVWTYNPAPLAAQLASLRFQLIKDGHLRPSALDDLAGFHACQDPRPRRETFVNAVRSHLDWNFASIVVEKNRVNAAIQVPEKFYSKFLTMVLNFVLRGRIRPSTNRVLIYTDTLPMRSRRESTAVNTTVKASCQKELRGKKFTILHHPSESNYWLQIADYCSWSICRKWEFNDCETYELLKDRLAAPEIAPMSRGDGTVYY